MKTVHTPGPWALNTQYADIEVRGPAETGVLIAVMSPWGDAADTPSPQRANARLIAAAPDLLAELQAAHKLLQLALKHMGGERQSLFAAESERLGLGTDGATRYHERAAVLAKATGVTA